MLVKLDAQPGTSNPRMTKITTDLSRELRSIPGVDNVGGHVGRAVTGDQRVDVNSSEVWVSIDSGADYDATLASIKDTVNGTGGVQHDVTTYSSQKIRDVGALNDGDNPNRGNGFDVLTGTDKPLVVRVFGQEQDVLRRQAERVRQLVAQVDGVVDPRVAQPDDSAAGGDRGRPRQGAALPDQAGRRASRGGGTAPGHHGRQRVRGPEGLRRDRAG